MATSKNVSRGPTQQPPFGSNKIKCDTHGQQLRKYCPSHLMPCCEECISQSHSKCIGITSLLSVVEKTNIEKSKESVGKEINLILHFLNKLANNKFENIQKGEKQYQSIKESISEIRVEINKHLDNLEKKLCKEADTIWGQEKSKLTDFIKEIEEQKKRLKEMQDDLRKIQEHTSKLQSFLGVHQIEQQVHQLYAEQKETVTEVDIKLKQNDEIEQIQSKVQSLTSLGEVKVDENEITLRKEVSVSREAQVEQSNINNITMNLETPINLNSIDGISDMICLTDGRVIAVEAWGDVYILTSDGKLLKKLPLSRGAWSVTQIKQDTIAITYPRRHSITIFNMENETITKDIKLDKSCWSLFLSNNALVVALFNNEIRTIDLEGTTQKSIEVQSESSLYYLVNWNDRAIYSDLQGKAVSCIDGTGTQIWQYQQDFSGPKGLCTDTYGNIIVADEKSVRLIVISKDGKESKVLISAEDGLACPQCICLNGSSGFICSRIGLDIFITKFNLSYE
ncbi:chromosome partition protein Smc-like [Mytilus edulis]|uniref:chromosome partition protein Smc-like n=1 Tax=Mytilus edulis TaxID=6550 RepID=UPI0039EFC1B1